MYGTHPFSMNHQYLNRITDVFSLSVQITDIGESMNGNYLCMDFASNRVRGQKDTVFSTGLEAQFENLVGFRNYDFEDFVREHFLIDDAKVFFSYPNFKRGEGKDAKGGRFYNNVAVRFPQENGGDDLILMGDIYERERNGHRQFRVKAILTMDPNTVHYGEIPISCDTVVRLGDEWGWETLSGEHTQYPTDDQVLHSVLTNDFMIGLEESYVVKDVQAVLKTLDDWDGFIASRKHILRKDSEAGYDLGACVPKTLIGYRTSADRVPEDAARIPFLKVDGDIVWTTEEVDSTSQEIPLIHLYVDIPRGEYEQSKKEKHSRKKAFDAFTRNPNAIVNPYTPVSDKNPYANHILRIRDGRISASVEEVVEPKEMLDAMRDEYKRKLASEERKIGNSFSKLIKNELSEFESTEAVKMVSLYREEQREPVTRRMASRAENIKDPVFGPILKKIGDQRALIGRLSEEIDELEDDDGKAELINKRNKASDVIDELQKGLDTTPYVERELDKLCRDYLEVIISDRKAELEGIHKPKMEKAKEDLRQDINEMIYVEENRIKEEHTIIRLHVYYELDIPDTDDVRRALKEIDMAMSPNLSLRKDFTGDRVVLDREEKALRAFREGHVMNPFLATAMFSPNISGESSVSGRVKMFYQDNLNQSQKIAVERAVSSNGMFLIQGPPGTGKTQVIAEITTQLAKSGRKVLIASENNKAVDNAFGRIPRFPDLRMMRMVANEKADKNRFSQRNLLANFYESIASSLDREVGKYNDLKGFIDSLDEDISILRGISEEIDDIESECIDLDIRIREATVALDTQYRKKHRIESDNMEAQDRISELEGRLESIRKFDDGGLINEIFDRIREDGMDPSGLKEPKSLFSELASRSILDLMEEFKVYADNAEYFALVAEKESSNDLRTISELNERIWKYEYDHDFDMARDVPTLCLLPSGLDLKVIKRIKEIAEEVMDEKVVKLRTDIDMMRSLESDTSSIDREIARSKSKIDSMKGDPAYTKRENLKGQFNSKAKEVFANLNKSPSSSNREDILDSIMSLRQEANDMFGASDSETEDILSAIKRIIKYLRADGIVENDRDEYNPALLKLVNIIGMTCTAKDRFTDEDSKSVKLNELNIDVVIIDEVSKVPFIELLQPILYGKTVILVGDHKQLPPIFTERVREEEMGKYDPELVNERDEQRYRRMYEESFFKTLFDKTPDSNKVMLNVQYRMHPDIMDAINVFYGDNLSFGGNPSSKDHYLTVPGARGRPVIEPSRHIIFIDCKGRERQESGSTSFSNEMEAEVVRKLLISMDKCCVSDRLGRPLGEVNRHNDQRLSVGVICPYADQARLIRGRYSRNYRSFNDGSEERFMVKTVDDFQGDERDVIILSMVRTNPNSQFLSDFRRINVAASRARRLLIVVGNRQVLEKMKVKVDDRNVRVYKDMIDRMDRKGCVLSSSDILGGE